jgi:ribosomal protein S27AE
MDHPNLKFILRLPDGKIQLATQPHTNNKKFMLCPHCPASIIYPKGRNQATCTKCHSKVPVVK